MYVVEYSTDKMKAIGFQQRNGYMVRKRFDGVELAYCCSDGYRIKVISNNPKVTDTDDMVAYKVINKPFGKRNAWIYKEPSKDKEITKLPNIKDMGVYK